MSKILILENDYTGKTYRDYLSAQLPDHKFIWCSDIESAQKKIDDSFSVVILDQRLDNNELGTSFMTWCKAKYPHIVGIMFSALATKSDVDGAFNKKLIIASIEKSADGLIKLPEVVVTAINESEYRRVTEQADGVPQLIGQIWRWKAPFSPLKVYKVSDYLKDRSFIDDNSWETVWTRHAGQKTSNKKVQEINYTVKVNCETSITAGVSVDKIKEIVSNSIKLDSDIKFTNSYDYTEKSLHETEEVFVMPDVSSDPNTTGLSLVTYEINRIFEVHLIGLKIYCPLCKQEKYVTCEVHIPTNRKVNRKVHYYDNGTKQVLAI